MNPVVRYLFYGLITCLVIAGSVFAFIYAGKIRSSQISSLKSEAKKEYLAGKFQEAAKTNNLLIDSFKIDEEAVRINFANAGFLAFGLESGNFMRNVESKYEGVNPDSSNLKNLSGKISLLDEAQQQYLLLTKTKSHKIASMANNQLGILSLKTEGSFIDEGSNSPDKVDSLIKQSIILFQEALRKDPANDSARYNYELLKTKLDFPLMVYTKAEQLVQQRRYRDAYQLMEKAIKRDTRTKKYEDFRKKVYSIYQIDSLKRS